MERKGATGFTSQTFISDWAVISCGAFNPLKETRLGLPSLTGPPPTDVENEENHNDKVYNKANGQDVVPSRR